MARRPLSALARPGPLTAVVLALAPLCARAEPPAVEPDPALSLRAVRLTLSPEGIEAEGGVRLRLSSGALPGCPLTLRAVGLELSAAGALLARYPRLRLGRVRLRAAELRLDPGGAIRARFPSGTPCTCPDGEPLVTVSARRATVDPAQKRMTLRGATLRLAGRGVAPSLPYWWFPLRPGVSGALAPDMGYSSRDGVRLVQGVYWAPERPFDLLVRGGWVQRRGALGGLRLRHWAPGCGRGQLSLVALGDGDRFRGAARGAASIEGRGWAGGLSPDLVSDSQLLRDLALQPARVAAPLLRSRLWGALGRGPLYLWLTGDLLQDLNRGARPDGRLELRGGVLPRTLWGPLQGTLSLGASYFHAADPGETLFWPEVPAQELLLHLRPALVAAGAVGGALRLTGALSYDLLGVGLVPRTSPAWAFALRQQLRAGGEAALPLARSFAGGAYRHSLEPYLALRWQAPLPGVDDEAPGLMPRLSGGVGTFGLRSRLSRSRSGRRTVRLLAMDLALSLPALAEVGGDPWTAPLVDLELALGPLGPLSLKARGTAGLEPLELHQATAALCAAGGALGLCLGYQRLSIDALHLLPAGQGRDMTTRWRALAYPLHGQQLSARARARFGPLRLFGELALDPSRGEPVHGRGGLTFTWGCGCHSVTLSGAYRWDLNAPELGLRLALFRGGATGCNANSVEFSKLSYGPAAW